MYMFCISICHIQVLFTNFAKTFLYLSEVLGNVKSDILKLEIWLCNYILAVNKSPCSNMGN